MGSHWNPRIFRLVLLSSSVEVVFERGVWILLVLLHTRGSPQFPWTAMQLNRSEIEVSHHRLMIQI